MQNFLKKILKPRVNYQPLIEVRVFKDALLHNLREYQKHYPKLRFAPVLKSNAYGHGLVEVAGILDQANRTLTPTLSQRERGQEAMPFFMVDSFYEALTLRQHGIKTKILILGYVRDEQIINNKLKDISFGIIDMEQLKNIAEKLTSPQNFHLKIDTGMHRQGILMEDAQKAIELIKSNRNFILEGVCSHFADADGPNAVFTEAQTKQWNVLVKVFRTVFPEIKYFHISNTAGTGYADKIDANVSRLGIGLYGIAIKGEEGRHLDLKPALEMASVISSLKTIGAGEKVGYGITFESQKRLRAATVPVGYNEGVDRRLSNCGCFKVKDTFCPIVGRVSMNMSSIDVTEAPGAKLEDKVIIISREKTDKNSVENIAKLCDCITYEVLVRIPSSLRRILA